MPAADDSAPIPDAAAPRTTSRRFWLLAAVVVLIVVAYAMGWHRQLSLETLVRHRTALDALVGAHFGFALAAFIAIYIVAVSLAMPGTVWLTLAGGVLFGAIIASATTIVAATIGATSLFLLVRGPLSDLVRRRAGSLAAKIVDGLRADAFSYILFLRLVPLFPFFLVNLAVALCGVGAWSFVIATAIGIMPATIIFASVGAGLDSAIAAQENSYQACLAAGQPDCGLNFDLGSALTPQLMGGLLALGALALLPVLVKYFRMARQPMP